MFNQNRLTMNVYIDGTATLSQQLLACSGEMGALITVVVDVDIKTLADGNEAQLHFLTPSGKAYYKGGYDLSDGTITITIGANDYLLIEDGELEIQLVITGNAEPGLPEVE